MALKVLLGNFYFRMDPYIHAWLMCMSFLPYFTVAVWKATKVYWCLNKHGSSPTIVFKSYCEHHTLIWGCFCIRTIDRLISDGLLRCALFLHYNGRCSDAHLNCTEGIVAQSMGKQNLERWSLEIWILIYESPVIGMGSVPISISLLSSQPSIFVLKQWKILKTRKEMNLLYSCFNEQDKSANVKRAYKVHV